MNNITTIPEQSFDRIVKEFYINVEYKTIKVRVKNDIEGNNIIDSYMDADLPAIWSLMNDSQKTIVKGFFKALAAQALEVNSADVIGEFTDEA